MNARYYAARTAAAAQRSAAKTAFFASDLAARTGRAGARYVAIEEAAQ